MPLLVLSTLRTDTKCVPSWMPAVMPAIADWLLYTRHYLDATYRVAFVRVLVVRWCSQVSGNQTNLKRFV